MLKFSKGNAKLGSNIYTFSLPAGHSCPFANVCLAKADKVTGKIQLGKNNQFQCFSVTSENMFPNVRKSRWRNFEALRALDTAGMFALIQKSLPSKAGYIRIHVSGDFFSQAYFDAWVLVAKANPQRHFYAYTKSIPFWTARIKELPVNFILNGSIGGKRDDLIAKHNLKSARVVFSESEAIELKLKIDHDDSFAMKQGGNFALLLHGTQPKGSLAAKANYILRKAGKNGYAADYFGHYKPKTNEIKNP